MPETAAAGYFLLIMKKNLIKIGILVAAFLLSVVGFSSITNQTNEDRTREMAPAELPVVTLFYGETPINELRAYTNEMEIRFMRDTITPLMEDKILPLMIDGVGKTKPTLNFQIRSLDGEQLLADGAVDEFRQESGMLRTEIEVQSIIDPDHEYSLILTLTEGDRNTYFYTRILLPGEPLIQESLDFVSEFHTKALDKNACEELTTWLEPDATGDNTTLHKVNIHSSLDQISYGELAPEVLIEPIPRIVEINSSYSVVMMDYVLTRKSENGEDEYYNTEEYFRVRHTDEREYLLNYERTMNQIYREDCAYFYNTLIQLGIRDPEVDYVVNEDQTMAAYVQEGDLWSVNFETGKLFRVFSFRSAGDIDPRENDNAHEIRIINMDENGSVRFVVAGYMNRGDHEGQCGIAVYEFDGLTNTVEEQAFIPLDRSFPVLRSDLDGVIYENNDAYFYFMLGGSLYDINLNSRKIQQQLSSLNEKAWCCPESGRYLVFQSSGDQYTADKMTIMDLEEKTSFDVTAGEGEYLKPLGFIQEDLIYGVARATDVYTDAAGIVTFPMYKVCIMNAGGDHALYKEYQKEGYFVSDISVDGFTIYLDRLQRSAGGYEPAEPDTIMNREGEDMEKVSIHTTVTVVKETEIQIDMGKEISNTTPKVLTPKDIRPSEDRTVALPGAEPSNLYYVYSAGNVLLSTDTFREAVIRADENMGVVVDTDMRYLWMRARALSVAPIPLDKEAISGDGGSVYACVRGMLASKGITIDVESLMNSGQTPKQILESSLKDSIFLDLSGCDISQTLYYISNGAPVFAMSSAATAVLLVGYDGGGVTWFDPLTQSNSYMAMDDAREFFGSCGNIYFTYTE